MLPGRSVVTLEVSGASSLRLLPRLLPRESQISARQPLPLWYGETTFEKRCALYWGFSWEPCHCTPPFWRY